MPSNRSESSGGAEIQMAGSSERASAVNSDIAISEVEQRVIGHPLRLRLVGLMAERPGLTLSPSEAASLLHEPLSATSYHMAVLRSCGAIRLVREIPIRGALKHLYGLADELADSHLIGAVLPQLGREDSGGHVTPSPSGNAPPRADQRRG